MAETASGKALALGRVLGSLCVLTAKDGDAQGAMLASWVSQVRARGPLAADAHLSFSFRDFYFSTSACSSSDGSLKRGCLPH